MRLYFSPLSCSMATRIALYEARTHAEFVEVDPVTKLTTDGRDYRKVYPLGLVPALETEDGTLLTENAAILQWVADRHPHADLAPNDPLGRTRLHQWLCFIGTELHKGLFVPLLDAKAPEGARTYALEKGASRLALLDEHLRGREFLLDRFSVADGYLATVLSWSVVTPIDLSKWPAVRAYLSRMHARPSVARAIAEERPLWEQEVARHKAH